VQQSIDISCRQGTQQQTCHTLLERSTDGTDRTDNVPVDIKKKDGDQTTPVPENSQ